MTELTIPLRSQDEAVLVLGPYDRYAKLLRQDLGIELYTRRGNLRIKGGDDDVQEARRRIEHLLGKSRKGRELEVRDVEAILLAGTRAGAPPPGDGGAPPERSVDAPPPGIAPPPPRRSPPVARAVGARPGRIRAVQPRTENQRRYWDMMHRLDLVLALGVAGTGKTYLAVASAVRSLREGQHRRLVITRPVVEAGERLGFLPGDVQAKLNPYMRPIYDALHSLLEYEDVARFEEEGVIEVAPLAYMRGRTLSDAFVILDEAQNTTIGQMKMFLTRMGEGSRMVVTGDPSQTDLDAGTKSGLLDAVHRLRGIEDIGVAEFDHRDIVRHPLVEKVLRAYDQAPTRRRAERGEG